MVGVVAAAKRFGVVAVIVALLLVVLLAERIMPRHSAALLADAVRGAAVNGRCAAEMFPNLHLARDRRLVAVVVGDDGRDRIDSPVAFSSSLGAQQDGRIVNDDDIVAGLIASAKLRFIRGDANDRASHRQCAVALVSDARDTVA